MRVWTDMERARHAALMREKVRAWSPWKKSTGPRSVTGKKRASLNAMKHGLRSVQGRRLLSLFQKHRYFLKTVYAGLKNQRKSTNELIKGRGKLPISPLHNSPKCLEWPYDRRRNHRIDS